MRYACILVFILGVIAVVYGLVLQRLPSEDNLPFRLRHTVEGPSDIRRIGRALVWTGCGIALVSSIGFLVTLMLGE